MPVRVGSNYHTDAFIVVVFVMDEVQVSARAVVFGNDLRRMVIPTERGLGVFDIACAIPEFFRCIDKIGRIGKPGIQQLVRQLLYPFGAGLVGHLDLD